MPQSPYFHTNPRPLCLTDRMRRAHLIAVIAIIFGWLSFGEMTAAHAQGAKKAAAAKKGGKVAKNAPAAPKEIEPDDEELPNVSFDAVDDPDDHEVVDPDETSNGKQRLDELFVTAREKYAEYVRIMAERRPLAGRRDVLAGEMNQHLANINEHAVATNNRNERLKAIDIELLLASGDRLRELQAEKSLLNGANQQSKAAANYSDGQIAQRRPTYDALNVQLKPLDDRLRQIWQEMNACRKQWLELRVPHEKYARAEFEVLKRAIDDWSRIDGLWPQAHCWAALCAYELGDYDAARDRVEKADKIRVEVYWSKKRWPTIEAIKGLVAAKHPDLRVKASDFLHGAKVSMDKKTDWETPFICGRATMAKKGQSSQAEALFKQALKIKPRNIMIKYNIALLKVSGDKGVMNVAEGTKQLEEIWTQTGKRSWRIGFELAKAYQAGGRAKEAESQLEETRSLAPVTEHDQLKLAKK